MAALTVIPELHFAVECQTAESLTPPKRQTVSEWCEENIVLDVSQEPGKLRLSRTPYARRILDAVGDPTVKRVTLMTCTQVAKTTIEMCALAYAIDQAPGDALFVLPTEDLCKNFSKGRLGKLLRRTDCLRRAQTGDASDLSMFRYAFTSMTLYLAWANSPAMLSSNPVRYVFMDEVGKFPPFSGCEADPTKLATERCKNFWNRKVIQASSPTKSKDYISREFMNGTQEYFHVPCPHCGMKQTLVWQQIKWPDGEWDANRTRSKRLAWYECAVCGGKILDHHKRRMLMDGEWIARNPGGDHLSFHLNSIYSPWLTFSDVAAEFQECRGRPELMMNFTNSWLGEVWHEKAEDVTAESVEKLRGVYASGLVPTEAVVLTAGADVQKTGVYWSVRAWGAGDGGEESWLVDWGFIKRPDDRSNADLAALDDAVLGKVYPSVDGNRQWAVRMLCIDSGYRTHEVYAFAYGRKERVRATKGASSKPATPLTWNRIDRDRQGKVMKWSQTVGLVDTEYFKDKIHARRTCQPALWHLPSNVTKEYVAQVSAEHKVIERDTKGRPKEMWAIRPDAGDNHWWDAEVGCAVAAHHLGVPHTKALKREATIARRTEPEGGKKSFIHRSKPSGGGRGGFVSRGK